MEQPYPAGTDFVVLPHHEFAGDLGFLPINAYLIKAREPVLVDTGIVTEGAAFIDALRGEIDLDELRWILLTHEDLDHAGAVVALMHAAPNARLVLSYLAMAKGGSGGDMSLMDRLVIATPGETVIAGDRRFGVLRPPVFDSSATIAYFDEKTSTLFSADAFGGLVPHPSQDVASLGTAYTDGCAMFTLANSAWLHLVDPARLEREIGTVRTVAPDRIMAAHAAPLEGRTQEVCDHLAALPAMDPVRLPRHEEFRALLARMKTAGAAA
jgi:glyoxylase-like metal-dependent hydrolase (beta-lactamase superfamily II)